MTWQPNPRVVIGGRDYTGDTVGRVSAQRGRRDVDSAASAASAQVTLRDADGEGFEVRVGEPLELWLDDSSGTSVQVFGGQVQELALSTVATGGGDALVVWQVSASGPFARLNRRSVLAGGRPAENDGERVAAAISAGLGVAWEEYSASQTWAQVNGATTWQTLDPGFDATLIDAGVYGLAALGSADAGYGPLSVAQDAAFSARGVLYETRDGFIGYADANRRQTAGAGTALEIPTSTLSQSGLGFRQILTSLVNRATVAYSGGAVTVSDDDSVREYGVWQTELTTQLATLASGSAVAAEIVNDRASPAFEVDEVQVQMVRAGDGLRDALLEVEPNDYVRITGMPGGLPTDDLLGFVESVGWSSDEFTTLLTLGVSDAVLSIGAVRWSAVGTAVTWASIGTAVKWPDARSL